MSFPQNFLLACLSLSCVACGPGTTRIGMPRSLPSGVPQNSCERERWLEIVPASTVVTAEVNHGSYTTYYSAVATGVGVFQQGEQDPEDVDNLWWEMNEPALQKEHEARIAYVDEAWTRSFWWGGLGTGLMFAGLGTAAVIQPETQAGAIAAGATGLVAGLVGVIGMLANQPSGIDQMHADARSRLFIAEEDDLEAVDRGVDRANQERRRRCRAGR